MTIETDKTAQSVRWWLKAAMNALMEYQHDYGDELPDSHEIGRIDESRGSASFRLTVGHLRQLHAMLAAAPQPPASASAEHLGRFGHHPDPAVDFCIEVEAVGGEVENLRIGFATARRSRDELRARIERALSFRVGGDEGAVRAKDHLREVAAKFEVASASAGPLTFAYRNWRGEVSERRAIPQQVYFGSTEWHPEPQWLMRALDVDKGEVRDFAMRDMGPASAGSGKVEAEPAVSVKPLKWVDRSDRISPQYVAESIVGSYSIDRTKGGAFLWWTSALRGKVEVRTLEAAKAAAQADYERRIRSALQIEPAHPDARQAEGG